MGCVESSMMIRTDGDDDHDEDLVELVLERTDWSSIQRKGSSAFNLFPEVGYILYRRVLTISES